MTDDINREAVWQEESSNTLYEILYWMPMKGNHSDIASWRVYVSDVDTFDEAEEKAVEANSVYRRVKIHRITREFSLTRVWESS